MLVLQSEEVLVRVDPQRGAEILDLVDLLTGRQLLGRLPFGTEERHAGVVDEAGWIAGWRGGWQVCTPNPGNPARVGEEEHAFHGRASYEPWEVLSAGGAEAVLRWRGQGLEIERSLQVAGDTLEISMTHRATGPRVPYAALEHVALGLEILDPLLELELPAARTIELSDRDGPVRAPRDAPRWPRSQRLDGSVERLDRLALATPTSRFACVQDLEDGWAVARGRRAGLELRWDAAALPHVWVWYELRSLDGPFRGMAEIVALEPASVPHSLGLARAVEEGQASWLDPGERASYGFRARVLRP
jgi:galactose mutarotase-like enzyme